MADEKKRDWIDVADVLAKLLIPVAVGVSVMIWNQERTRANTISTMTEIAIGILQDPLTLAENNHLREWAVTVLQEPSNPPNISEDVAQALLEGASLDRPTWACFGKVAGEQYHKCYPTTPRQQLKAIEARRRFYERASEESLLNYIARQQENVREE